MPVIKLMLGGLTLPRHRACSLVKGRGGLTAHRQPCYDDPGTSRPTLPTHQPQFLRNNVFKNNANLRDANLRYANLRGAKLSPFQIVPEEGSFIAFKKVDAGVIKIMIPDDAKRTSTLVGRKCRASHILVWEGSGKSPTHTLEYREGEIVVADSYDDDIRVECTNGIHFFMTRKEAEEWGGLTLPQAPCYNDSTTKQPPCLAYSPQLIKNGTL